MGELLERLASKKSRFIVHVLSEYIQAHPEVGNHGSAIQIQPARGTGLTREQVRELIREELVKAAVSLPTVSPETELQAVREKSAFSLPPANFSSDVQPVSEDSIDAMLSNLEEFFA